MHGQTCERKLSVPHKACLALFLFPETWRTPQKNDSIVISKPIIVRRLLNKGEGGGREEEEKKMNNKKKPYKLRADSGIPEARVS